MLFSASSCTFIVTILIRCTFNEAFVLNTRTSPPCTSTELQFGLPSFGTGKDDEDGSSDEADDGKPTKSIGVSGLVQLITAGMGSPFLGNFEGVEKETGKMMFSLEANNLVDEDGNSKQTAMPYFESGWVDEKDAEKERKKNSKNAKKGGKFKLW